MTCLSEKEIREISKIHKERFDNEDFISSCNVNIIARFYARISKESSNIIIIEKENDEVAAFALFTVKNRGLFKKFIKSNFFTVLLSPQMCYNLIKTLFYKISSGKLPEYDIELAYIAAGKRFESKGYAGRIIQKGEEILLSKKIGEYFLQVYKDNNRAVNFYKKAGFTVYSEFISRHRAKLLLKKVIISE